MKTIITTIIAAMALVSALAQPPLPTLPTDYYGVPRIGENIPDANWKTTTGANRYPAQSYWAQSTNRFQTPHAFLSPFGDWGASDLWIMVPNSRVAGQWPKHQLNWWCRGEWNSSNGDAMFIRVGSLAWQVAWQQLSEGWVRYSVEVPPLSDSTVKLSWEIRNGSQGRFYPAQVHVDAIQWLVVPVLGPPLSTSRSGSNLVISWKVAGSEGYRLVKATNITGPWSNFVHTRATNAGVITVTVPMPSSRSFFQLVNP